MSDTPAGWYPLPDDPHTMRYWDGEEWTEHTHTFDEPVGLGNIGELIGDAFNAVREQFVPIVILSAILLILPNYISTYFTERTLDGLRVFLPENGEIEVVGFDGGDGMAFAALFMLPYAIATIHTLAITWLMLRTQHNWGDGTPDQSWTRALGPAMRATPRVLIVLLGVFLAYAVAAGVVVTLGAVLHPATLLLTIPAAIIGFIWVFVKVMPTQVVAFAAPKRPLLSTSASISEGRFFPVLGRILLLMLVGLAITFALSIVGQLLDSGLGGGPEITFTNDTLEIVGTSSTGALLARSVVGAFGSGLSSAILAAGLITVYRNAGGPFDRDNPTDS